MMATRKWHPENLNTEDDYIVRVKVDKGAINVKCRFIKMFVRNGEFVLHFEKYDGTGVCFPVKDIISIK